MDGDAPEPIEVELVANDPTSSAGWWRRPDAAEPSDGDGPERPDRPGNDRSRLVVVAAVTAVLSLALGWIVGRSTNGDGATDASTATRPTSTTVPEPLVTLPIVGDEIDGAEFDEPDEGDQAPVPVPPGPMATEPVAEPVAEPTTEPIAVDERLAGVPVRLVGIELGGALVEADLAIGTLTDYRVDRVTTDGSPLVVGDDWVVASSFGRLQVVRSDGTMTAFDVGESWQILHVPGTDWFWRSPSGYLADGNVYRLVDLDGEPVGPELEMPTNAWSSMVDPRTGGVVLQNVPRSYSITPDGAEYLGAGEVVGIGRDVLVTYDCDESLDCSLSWTDRNTGVTAPIPADPDLGESYRWVSVSGWTGASAENVSPDGRWVAIVGLSGQMASVIGVIELATGRFVDLGSLAQYPPAIMWSPDGRWAFVLDDQVPVAYDTVTGDRFPVFTDTVQWVQLGIRPPGRTEPGAAGGTLLSASPEEPVEG